MVATVLPLIPQSWQILSVSSPRIRQANSNDVYATGGTMNAVEKLCEKAGYTVIGKLVLIDLRFLHEPNDVKSLIQYE